MAGKASTAGQVSQLLRKGLDFYGAGDVAHAFLTCLYISWIGRWTNCLGIKAKS